MPSIRRHLLLGAAAAITAVFAVLAGILYLLVRTWMIAEFDRGLLAQAESLKATTEFHHGKVRIDFDGEQPAQFVGGPHAQYFELWQDGRPVARSPSLGGKDLSFQPPPSNRSEYRFAALPGGATDRQMTTSYELRREPEDRSEQSDRTPLHASLMLVVGGDTSQLSSALMQLRWLLAASCGAALLIGLGLLAWIIDRALQPVKSIAGCIERVGRASLAERLQLSGVPRELRPIIDRLNEMLCRLESAFSREQAFTADVAHELRTPLAGLETTLEVCASRMRPPQEYQKVLARCLGVCRQMHTLVDSLLTLARADAGSLAVACQPFCLETLLDESWSTFADRAACRNLRVTRRSDVHEAVYTDREKLRQVLHNVFDNAVSYADQGGMIFIRAHDGPQEVSISVSNTGSRLSQDQATQAFERFWRVDPARSETGTHCGLGLAITRELIAVLGGTIFARSKVGGEFSLHIALPANPDRQGRNAAIALKAN